MDSFNIKVEKSSAILRHKRVDKITTLFRLMEVCTFLFIVAGISAQLPLDFRVSSDHIRRFLITIFSPGFLFILVNGIVLVLFFKSGQVSPQQTNDFNKCTEFYNEYVESCGKRHGITCAEEDNEKQGKGKESLLDSCSFEDRKMRLSKSENSRDQNQNSCRKVRRTVTENGGAVENYSERSVHGLIQKTCDHEVSPQTFNPKCYAADEISGEEFRREVSPQTFNPKCYAADEMSGEEFRRRVEHFIARQQRSMRE